MDKANWEENEDIIRMKPSFDVELKSRDHDIQSEFLQFLQKIISKKSSRLLKRQTSKIYQYCCNDDLKQAIVDNFSENDIKRNKKQPSNSLSHIIYDHL